MTLLLTTLIVSTVLATMIFSPHPLMLTIKAVAMATALCLALSHMSSWYAFMVFIVMVGGMLIMFMYISSLSPNSIFCLKLETRYFLILLTTLTTIFYSMSTFKPINTQPLQDSPMDFITFFWLHQNLTIFLLMTIMLLLAMLISTTLLKTTEKPLRPTKLVS
uniref:NADH dehydrogenase subunit 6 n=1 Tax=Physunio superbus TaxID=2494254 RepID=A0A8A3WK87_9BIVA|nr:NADH dehydrogenase subunit 6 [Physunio superbus]